jgi:MFS family permease
MELVVCAHDILIEWGKNMTTIKPVKYQNYLFVAFILMLTGMMASLNQFKLPTIMTDVAASFQMSMEQASWMMSIFTMVGIFLALPTGGLAQKYGAKNILVVATLFVAGGSIIGSMATSGGVMIFSRGLEGIGFIFITVCGPLAITCHVEPAKIGSAIGIWATWVALGQIIANNLTPPLFTIIGRSGVWLIYAVVTLAFGAASMFLVKTPQQTTTDESLPKNKVKTSEAFKSKNLWLLCLSFSVFCMILMAILAFSPTVLISNGVSITTAAFVTSLPMILSLIASPFFGVMVDKFGKKKRLYLLTLLAMGPAAVMIFTSTGPLMYGGIFLLGLVGMGLPPVAVASIGSVIKKPEFASVSMGLFMLFQNAGFFFGTVLMPYFLKFAGGSWAGAGMILLPICLLGVGIAAMIKLD